MVLMRIISGKARGTKLYTLEGIETRPTLDRVKESIFNIIQNRILESNVLDLFSGSGAIGLEMVSRGANKSVLCDNSKKAIEIIKKNIEKTHMNNKVEVYNLDYEICLEKIKNQKFNLIYLDPPYKTNFISKAMVKIVEFNLLNDNGIIIIETNDEKRILDEIKNLDVEVKDKRKYGRASIIFLNKRA